MAGGEQSPGACSTEIREFSKKKAMRWLSLLFVGALQTRLSFLISVSLGRTLQLHKETGLLQIQCQIRPLCAHIRRCLKCPYMTIFNQLEPTINAKYINKFVNMSEWFRSTVLVSVVGLEEVKILKVLFSEDIIFLFLHNFSGWYGLKHLGKVHFKTKPPSVQCSCRAKSNYGYQKCLGIFAQTSSGCSIPESVQG